MRSVLGIDAAWTLNQPSGVALAVEEPGGWHLVVAESSYQRFLAQAAGDKEPKLRPSGAAPNVDQLLSAARALGEQPVELIAIDMPLSLSPITKRRVSDNEVSRVYGARWCSTHTPSATRPGRISDVLCAEFAAAGYPLRTTPTRSSASLIPGLIEVYPHPALVELARAEVRLPYKAAKSRRYWPDATPAQRREHLLRKWAEITAMLEKEIIGVEAMLPKPDLAAPGWKFKAFEDALDAVVCAWVAVYALEGRAKPFGDEDSAIWVPLPATS